MSTVQNPLSVDKQRHHISQRHNATKQHLVGSTALRFQYRSFHKPWVTWRQVVDVVGWFRDFVGLSALMRQQWKTVLKGPSARLCFGYCNSIRSLRKCSIILVICWYLQISRVFSLHYQQRKHFDRMILLKWRGGKSMVCCDFPDMEASATDSCRSSGTWIQALQPVACIWWRILLCQWRDVYDSAWYLDEQNITKHVVLFSTDSCSTADCNETSPVHPCSFQGKEYNISVYKWSQACFLTNPVWVSWAEVKGRVGACAKSNIKLVFVWQLRPQKLEEDRNRKRLDTSQSYVDV